MSCVFCARVFIAPLRSCAANRPSIRPQLARHASSGGADEHQRAHVGDGRVCLGERGQFDPFVRPADGARKGDDGFGRPSISQQRKSLVDQLRPRLRGGIVERHDEIGLRRRRAAGVSITPTASNCRRARSPQKSWPRGAPSRAAAASMARNAGMHLDIAARANAGRPLRSPRIPRPPWRRRRDRRRRRRATRAPSSASSQRGARPDQARRGCRWRGLFCRGEAARRSTIGLVADEIGRAVDQGLGPRASSIRRGPGQGRRCRDGRAHGRLPSPGIRISEK